MTLEFLNFILKVATVSTLTLAYNNQNIYFSEINRNPSFHQFDSELWRPRKNL